MKYTQGIIVDGITYDIPFVSLKRTADFLDKYAARVESGGLERELIGVYYNFTLTAGSSDAFESDYENFYDHMTEPVAFHDFVLPWGKNKTFAFRGYASSVSDEYKKILEDDAVFTGFTMKMTAQVPARTPT